MSSMVEEMDSVRQRNGPVKTPHQQSGQSESEKQQDDRRSSHLPFWEPGSGYYGQTLGRHLKKITDDAGDFILKHLDTVPVRDNGVFTVGDYGTNDGSSSMGVMGRIIGHLQKKHGEKLPIQIIYEDQEKNDFNSLFNRLSNSNGLLSNYSNIYPFATNIGFYKQCVPEGTCDVIFTGIATHWLENPSVNFKDGIFHGTAKAESEELRRFFAEAEQDWNKFLVLRARELRKGGLLIILCLGTADDFQGRSTLLNDDGKTSKSPISRQGTNNADMLLTVDTVWRQLKEENIITQKEYETCLIAAAFRKLKECTAPFENPNSPVVKAGLSLVHKDQIFQGSAFKDLWRQKKRTDGVDDRAYFAELIAKSYMVPLRTSFETSLSHSRSAEEKEAILNELYKRFEAMVASRDPESYRSDYIINRLVARKV